MLNSWFLLVVLLDKTSLSGYFSLGRASISRRSNPWQASILKAVFVLYTRHSECHWLVAPKIPRTQFSAFRNSVISPSMSLTSNESSQRIFVKSRIDITCVFRSYLFRFWNLFCQYRSRDDIPTGIFSFKFGHFHTRTHFFSMNTIRFKPPRYRHMICVWKTKSISEKGLF